MLNDRPFIRIRLQNITAEGAEEMPFQTTHRTYRLKPYYTNTSVSSAVRFYQRRHLWDPKLAVNLFNNVAHHAPCGALAGFDDQIRNLPIERIPLLHQLR